MKILHVISQRPDSTGSGFYLQNLIRLAADAGHQNFLVAGMPAGEAPNLRNLEKGHQRMVTFSGGDLAFPIPGMSDVMPYPSSVFGRLSQSDLAAYEEAFADRIHSAAAAFRPDVIHTHHLWLVSALTRRMLPEMPMVTSCHSTGLRQFIQCIHLRARVLDPCRKIDRVLALSKDQRKQITDLYGISEHRIDIVGGGYDNTLFTWRIKPTPPPVHCLYAGKLSFAKGVDWLLRAWCRLTGFPLHLHLAGSGAGDEERVCRSLAETAGNAVTVHGKIGQEQLAALMRACHVFILPSFYEGLPLVLLEALASGCRIIATDLPGCRELLSEAGSDLVEWVHLPKLQTVDRPYAEDMERLEAGLAAAVTRSAGRVLNAPSPEFSQITAITAKAGWNAVFQRVSESYLQAIEHRRAIRCSG